MKAVAVLSLVAVLAGLVYFVFGWPTTDALKQRYKLFALAVSILQIALMVVVLPGLRWVWAPYVALTLLLDIGFRWLYGSPLTAGAIASALETHWEEALGFVAHVGGLPFSGAVLLAIGLAHAPRVLASTRRGSAGLLVLCLLAPMLKSLPDPGLRHDWQEDPVGTASFVYRDYLLFRDALKVVTQVREGRRLEALASMPRAAPTGVRWDSATQPPVMQTIVLVIGESAARRHHGVYGYPAGPDRFLMRLVKDHDPLLVVPDAMATAPLTRDSVPRMLSFASVRDLSPLFNTHSLLEVARQAGYETLWISNQPQTGYQDTAVSLLLKGADRVHLNRHHTLDLELLPVLADWLNPQRKQLIVLHLNGSHIPYVINHDDEDLRRAAAAAPEFQHYDATIAHTDRVLEQVHRLVKTTGTQAVFYVADHGEIINRGHGFLALDRLQYEVPMVAWAGPATPRVVQRVQDWSSPADGHFSTGNLKFVVLELMGARIDPAWRSQALTDGDQILNVDGRVHPISALTEVAKPW